MLKEHPQDYFCPSALLANGWCKDVRLSVNDQGIIESLTIDAVPGDEIILSGAVIPGMPNVHSHAFQRVFAGLTESRSSDDFWGWRETMYRYAGQISPEQLRVIATHLYSEMLCAGFTSVAEFHYLHYQSNGQPYANIGEMSAALLQAAADTGIAITLLPVFYHYSGFGQRAAEPGQRRFASSTEQYLRLWQAAEHAAKDNPLASVGMAPHSLRAVGADDLKEILSFAAGNKSIPIHIHISEQRTEVDECILSTGQRPVAWLFENFSVDSRWCLVHCTHLDSEEINLIAESDCVVGLCPVTEANLGDGIAAAEELLVKGARVAIGSDSNVSLDVTAELRLLEYGQRLSRQRRNILTNLADDKTLWQRCARGGAQALAQPVATLAVGKRADFLVLDQNHTALLATPEHRLLDSLIFCADKSAIKAVYVAGRQVVENGRCTRALGHGEAFREIATQLRE